MMLRPSGSLGQRRLQAMLLTNFISRDYSYPGTPISLNYIRNIPKIIVGSL